MARTKQMRELEEMLFTKRAELEKLQHEIGVLEALKRRLAGEPELVARSRAKRSNVKQLVIDLLKERGDSGLNASLAVELAERRGERIERGTVSSLLSRLKAEGVVTYDNNVYRLLPTARAGSSSVDEASVH